MPGIDLLLAKSFSSKIKKNLDPKIEQELKLGLFKRYGLSIKQSMEDFSEFDEIFEEVAGIDSQKFEKDCFMEIVNLEYGEKEVVTLEIKDKLLVEQILNLLGNKETRKIIEETGKKPLLISEILQICKLSQTSGYRKINSLIRNGFLIKSGQKLTDKKRPIGKYSIIWKKINIEIQKEEYGVKMAISKKIIDNSTIIQTILN